MNISKRLLSLATLVDAKNVVDVGCDHALLSIYLTKQGKNCIAVDISKKVLESAKTNILKHKLENKILLIESDGTQNVKLKKDTCLVIAGMGTHTIIHILENADFTNIKELVIQTNNDYSLLRKYITKHGFYIDKEVSICEKKKYYVIIRFKKGFKKYTKYDYELGFLDQEYYQYLYQKNTKIINKLNIKHLFKKIKYIKLNHKIKQKLH